jgi:two-component system phosphate regulon sensor histidine kinase PhoR
MNLRAKIALTYIVLTVVGIFLASSFSSMQIRGYLNEREVETLVSKVEALHALIEHGSLYPDTSLSADRFLRQVAGALGVRITLIRRDGRVVFDSQVAPDSVRLMENHGSRPEVVLSRSTNVGIDRRISATLGQEFVYASKRLDRPSLAALDSGYVRGALQARAIQALDAKVQTVVWAVGAFTVLIITIATFRLSQRITRPIQMIARTAEAITNGQVDQRAAVRSRDEIGALASSINGMAEKLGSDIAQLKKLERVRSEFLANVSHELRTPIFSIQGFIETLLDGAVDDQAVNRDFLRKAHKHTARLNTLLTELIEISRIESGEMKMSFRYFSIADFVRQVVDEMRPQAERKGLRLQFLASGDVLENVYGDRDRLKQVLVNLIDNAIKYTDSGGSVEVGVGEEGNRCAVWVKDTGSGITEEHQGRIFERFYRVDRDRSREVGGTGLGLAIVKHIVEAHGGTIRVESAAGKGSTFTFTLKR